MAVFRVQKTQNYTIMSNHHLRNKALSLKAKGLLSLMLSLPEDWDYTTRGLAYPHFLIILLPVKIIPALDSPTTLLHYMLSALFYQNSNNCKNLK